MTTEEIFSALATHMIEGLMLHDQLADYYGFLGLYGYARAHEYHYHKESRGYRALCRYHISRMGRLVEHGDVQNPDVIPANWYRYDQQSVDAGTKRNAVKGGVERWTSWERETKTLYEKMYKELLELGEVSAANAVLSYIDDVDRELTSAEKKHLSLKSIEYDIHTIIQDQDALYEKYHRKLAAIGA